jgi:diguanylate cyclase (GGDEF)-like protein/PAS domain S-box-containing protein
MELATADSSPGHVYRPQSLSDVIIASASHSIIATDLQGVITSFNRAAESWLGYTASEVIGRHTLLQFHDYAEIADYCAEQADKIGIRISPSFEALIAGLGNGGTLEREWTYIRKSGSSMQVQVCLSGLWSHENKITGYLAIAQDVTSRADAQRELAGREREMRTLLDNLPDIVSRLDRNLRYTYVNPATEAFTGLHRSQILGKTPSELTGLGRRGERGERILRQVLETGEPAETEYRLPGENHKILLHARVIPEFDSEGTVTSVLVTCRNITAQRQAEDATRQRDATIRSFYDSSPLGMGVVSLEGSQVVWRSGNEAFARFVGLDPDDAIDATLDEYRVILPMLPEWIDRFHESERTGQPIQFEHQVQLTDQTQWLLVTVAHLRLHGASRSLFACTIHDTTEWKTAQVALKESEQRNRALVQAVPDLLYVADRTGNIVSILPGANTKPAVATSQILGHEWRRHLDADAVERLQKAVIRAIDHGEITTLDYTIESNGEKRIREARVVRVSEEQAVAVIRDITESRRSEMELTSSREMFLSAIEAMQEGLVLQNEAGEIVMCNHRAEELLGQTEDQMKGLTAFDPRWRAIHEDWSDYRKEEFPSVVARLTGQHIHDEMMGVFPGNGEVRWLSVNAAPIFNSQPAGPYGAVITFSDVTQRKQMEDALRAANEWLGEANEFLEVQRKALEEANARLEELATRDGLTGLLNHWAFQERLSEEISRGSRYYTPMSLVMVDVDYFKLFNDSFGHPAGDQVLARVAGILQATVRSSDVVARYGGEEFVILMPQTTGDLAKLGAERVRQAIESEPWARRPITVSLGVASIEFDHESVERITERADAALYAAKAAGRNTVIYAPHEPAVQG